MRHNFFFENPVFKRHTSATVRKIQKRFLRHSGCLLKQGGQKLLIVSYATQLFFSKTPCSSDTLVRQSEKSKKRFLRHSGCLLKQGGQKLFIVSYATQLFFSKTQCSSDTLVRQSEKSKKRFLRHSGRLLKQKGSQNCFICLMVQN